VVPVVSERSTDERIVIRGICPRITIRSSRLLAGFLHERTETGFPFLLTKMSPYYDLCT